MTDPVTYTICFAAAVAGCAAWFVWACLHAPVEDGPAWTSADDQPIDYALPDENHAGWTRLAEAVGATNPPALTVVDQAELKAMDADDFTMSDLLYALGVDQ
jgi:hypothetical protein